MVDEQKVEQKIEPLVVPVWPDAGMTLGLSRNGTYAAVARGEIPVLRFGRILRVSKKVLDRLANGEAA
jgi:hypothetical protein